MTKTTRRGMARTLRLRAALALVGGAALAACGGAPADPAPDAADALPTARELLAAGQTLEVPSFALTDQTGARFGTAELDGRVWVAHLTATRCTEVCPEVTAGLRTLQEALADAPGADGVRFVSFAADPGHDTPETLAALARDAGADADADPDTDDARWKFLAGTPNQVRQLGRHGLRLPVGDAPADGGAPAFPAADVLLVDRLQRIRGVFDGAGADGRANLERELRTLAAAAPLRVVAHPPEVLDPPWLDARADAQRAAAAEGLDAFHAFRGFRFTDRLHESGITFRNRVTDDSGKAYKPVHYDHGNGVAVADVDGDGRLDLYFTNQIGANELWRNLGGGEFENITHRAGVGLPEAISVAASFADTDNDGDADLFVTTVRGGNHLFVNDGTGAFTDATEAAGLGHVAHSSGAVFFDYNRDGRLDLFLCNVGVYSSDERGPGGYHIGFADAFEGHLQPERRNERSILYENRGGNVFADVTEARGLADESWTGDASPLDANGDGWPDLYVLNMQGHDEYFENVGGERFERRSRALFPRTPWGSMSIKVFDFDNDADMDILLSDMHSDMSEDVGTPREKEKARMQWPESMLRSGGASIFGNALFRNDGGAFTEASDALGVETYWPWGLSVGDLNADGFDDVFVAGGMNFPFRYGVNSVLLNDGGRRFVDSEFVLGVEPRRGRRTARPWFTLDCAGADAGNAWCEEFGLLEEAVVWAAVGSRASAIFDLDDDGDLDIVTNEFHDGPMVLVSDLAERTTVRRLSVRLVGAASNRDGLGADVTVRAGGRSYRKVHDGQSGYLSQSLVPLYFGLGDAETVDEITVVWPSGTRQTVPGPIAAGAVTVREEG